MATVSYKNQPGIQASHGNVPLAGNAHAYTVHKVLWPEEVERVIASEFVGYSLHVCCGLSHLGDVRLDLNQPSADVRADASKLPFVDGAFETVLCDPPYNGKFQWNHDLLTELSRVAQRRIIFQHWFMPTDKYGRYKKRNAFTLSRVYIWQPKTYFGRVQVISILDKAESPTLFQSA